MSPSVLLYRRLLSYVRPYWWAFALAVVGMIIVAAGDVLMAYMVMPIVQKLHQAIETMVARPEIRKKLEDLGLEIVPPEQRTPEYFAKFLKDDVERWGKVIKAAGIVAD